MSQNEDTWEPVALAIIFAISAFTNLYLVFFQDFSFYNYESPLGDLLMLAFLLFGIGFLVLAWGSYKRKPWVVGWGYPTAFLNIIFALTEVNIIGIGMWAFALYLVYKYKKELGVAANPPEFLKKKMRIDEIEEFDNRRGE